LFFNDVDQIGVGSSGLMNDPSGLKYTVVTAPANGKLFVDYNGNGVLDGTEAAMSTGSVFLQSDITTGHLVYSHGNGEQSALFDSFTFTVSDGTNVAYKGTSTISTTPTSGPWVMDITAGDKNDSPVMGNKVFWLEENSTGYLHDTTVSGGMVNTSVGGRVAYDMDGTTGSYNDLFPQVGYQPTGTATGSYIVDDPANYDTAGNEMFQLEQEPYNGVALSSGSKLVLKVAPGASLDYEVKSAYTVHLKVQDSSTTYGMASTMGQKDVWAVVRVKDMIDDAYAEAKTIGTQNAVSNDSFIYQLDQAVFPKQIPPSVAGANGAMVSYVATGTAVDSGWLHFEQESRTFWSIQGDPLRPTTSGDFVITVRAQYLYDNGGVTSLKNQTLPVTTQFTLHYQTVASLDLDAVMDALQYLDNDGDSFLPAAGDQFPVRDMMARAGAYPDANSEVSEVLSLLDAEAYAFDTKVG